MRIIIACAIVSALPDIDALFISVIPYNHPLGHRGLTHSLAFAATVGLGVAWLFFRRGADARSYWSLAILFALITASHGFFDAMTDGGLGVAFFSPFDNTRYFLPWRPIPVAPLSASALFTTRGLRLLVWELGLFWTFAAGSVFFYSVSGWRKAAAIACWIAALIVWIVALHLRG